jgi:uncharacterized membrane protein
MKVQFKIALIVSGICAFACILQIMGGLLCFLVATVCLIIALVKFAQHKNEEAQGYLLGLGISVLIGFSLCSYYPLVIH